MDPPPPPPVPVPRIVGSDDNGNFILELERGTYFGHIKDGEPHGVGIITFTPLKISIRTADETSTKLPVTV